MNEVCLKTLPFYFRYIESLDKYLLSNLAGSFAFLENRSQLKNLVNFDAKEISDEKIEELISRNFIAESVDYIDRINLVASKYASITKSNIGRPSLFMIVPTLRCDHDCVYCQVSRVPISKKGYDLDESHIQSIVDFIKTVSGDYVKIEFQGGEPLLNQNFIKKFIIEAKQKLNDKNLSFVICTALGTLDKDFLRWVREYDVVFSVSLDGPEDLHDLNRPSKYFNPYKRVISNIDLIKNELGEANVSCLATITKESLKTPLDLVKTYFNLGLESIFIRPLSPMGFASQKAKRIGYTANEYLEFYKKCLLEILSLNKERVFIEETALIHLRKIFRFGQANFTDLQSPAGYVFGALVFNYDGQVFGSDEARMLWESTKSTELVLGKLDDGVERVMNNMHAVSLLTDTFLSTVPGCEECAYQPYCGADPFHHLATQGDHIGDKSKSFFCDMETGIIDYLFELYETNPDAKEIFKKWLSL